MTLTIELTPEQEKSLKIHAQSAGMNADEYARQLLAGEVGLTRRVVDVLSAQERLWISRNTSRQQASG